MKRHDGGFRIGRQTHSHLGEPQSLYSKPGIVGPRVSNHRDYDVMVNGNDVVVFVKGDASVELWNLEFHSKATAYFSKELRPSTLGSKSIATTGR